MTNGRSKRTDEGPCDGPLSDRQLLRRFVHHDDEDAFAELVARYYGLVLGVCRRTLRDEHGAEDAFQATFFVLARRASQIRNRSSLAGWLHAVAYRTALRAMQQRQRRREEALRDDMTVTDDIFAQVATRYEQQSLDEELHRLPTKYREPLVLRYLMGKSNRQIAGELGVGVGVVEGRLKRGKDRLRLRLVKRGISLTAALAVVAGPARTLEAATADSLFRATIQTAAAFRTGAQPKGRFSESAIRLAEKELAMNTSTVAATTSGVAVALAVAGFALALGGDAGRPAQANVPEIAAAQTVAPVMLTADEAPAPVNLSAGGKREAKSAGAAESLPSAAEKIEAALREPAEVDFIETPLMDVIDKLAEMHHLNILIDQRALDDVGIPADCPITFSLSGVSLQSALNLMLRDLDLTWTIRDEVLLITTPEEAEIMLVTKVYEVGDLVMCQDASGDPWADHDSLIEVITTTVAPESWDKVGGPGSITVAPFRGAEMLVVAQTYQVHHEIRQILDEFRTIAEEKGSDQPPVREKPAPVPKQGMFGGMGGSVRPAAPPVPLQGFGGMGGGGGKE
jgi:RNA polymerase sigma factor (sigma-70 family)